MEFIKSKAEIKSAQTKTALESGQGEKSKPTKQTFTNRPRVARIRERTVHARELAQVTIGTSLILAATLMAADPAYGSRLESAVSSAQSTVVSIAQISSGIGIAVGAFLFSIGWSSAGRQVLSGAALGAFASFGGPAIIEFVRGLF